MWSVYQKNKDSRPTWGQVNVQNYDETKDSTEQVDIDDESATEGYNVASIMSYATVDDTNKYTDETLEKENDVDAEEVTRTSSSISKVFSFAQPALPTYPHGEIKIHSFGKELTTTTSR